METIMKLIGVPPTDVTPEQIEQVWTQANGVRNRPADASQQGVPKDVPRGHRAFVVVGGLAHGAPCDMF